MIPLYLDPDAPFAIHGLGGTIRLPIKNRLIWTSSPSITLHNPADEDNDTYDVQSIAMSSLFDEVVEPNVERDGSLASDSLEVQKIIQISGFIRAPSLAKLYDKITALNQAFNPILNDFQFLRFAQPTTDTSSWPLGYILQQYEARSIALPVPAFTKYDDHNAQFEIVLRLIDPIKYEQEEQEETRTGNGNITVDNTLATYASWPIFEIDTTASPAAGVGTITRDGTSRTMRFDGTKVPASETIIIDPKLRTAETDGGVNVIEMLKPTSQFFQVRPGESDAFSFAGFASGTVFRVRWTRAFV